MSLRSKPLFALALALLATSTLLGGVAYHDGATASPPEALVAGQEATLVGQLRHATTDEVSSLVADYDAELGYAIGFLSVDDWTIEVAASEPFIGGTTVIRGLVIHVDAAAKLAVIVAEDIRAPLWG